MIMLRCFTNGGFGRAFAVRLAVFAALIAWPVAHGADGIDAATMQRVYEEVKTPYKYGIVLRGETNQLVDCPSVFPP